MRTGLALFLLAGSYTCALSQTLTDDLSSPELWKPDRVPFSFKYAGKDSAELLKTWQTVTEDAAETKAQVQLYSYIDPVTHLKVTAEVRHYTEFPGVVDWVLRFRNNGQSDTPILDEILPLNSELPAAPGNLLTGDHGVIEAIGWSGNWRADFSFDKEGKTISLASGMKQTHFLLHPGEE